MDAEEKRALIERYLDAYSSFDIEGMMKAAHTEIEFRNVSGGKVNASASGMREFRSLAEESKRLFSSRRQTVTKFSFTADGVSIEVDYEGIAAVDLPNGVKAGEKLRLAGRSEFTFREGKIHTLTDYS